MSYCRVQYCKFMICEILKFVFICTYLEKSVYYQSIQCPLCFMSTICMGLMLVDLVGHYHVTLCTVMLFGLHTIIILIILVECHGFKIHQHYINRQADVSHFKVLCLVSQSSTFTKCYFVKCK